MGWCKDKQVLTWASLNLFCSSKEELEARVAALGIFVPQPHLGK